MAKDRRIQDIDRFVVETFKDCATEVFVRIKNQGDRTNHARNPTGSTENEWPVLHWVSTRRWRILLDEGLRAEGGYDVAHINMPPVSAKCHPLDPLRAVNDSVSPFIGNFRMQIWISRYA